MATANDDVVVRSEDPTETIGKSEFIDTASCRCALRPIAPGVVDPENTLAWRCIHDDDRDIDLELSGKWFFPASTPIQFNEQRRKWFSRPDTRTWGSARVVDDLRHRSRPLDSSELLAVDEKCTGELPEQGFETGKNPKLLSQRQAEEEVSDGFSLDSISVDEAAGDEAPSVQLPGQDDELPISEAIVSCIRGIGVPMQNASSWIEDGCLPGFYCKSNSIPLRSPLVLNRGYTGPENTIDLLPTYCVPHVECQRGRLSGANCPPQGKFEPSVCPAGSYCPPGGKEKIECPAGHWCSVGFLEPRPCSIGASCPKGTNRNMTFLAPAIILIVDILVIFVMVFFNVRRYLRNRTWKTTSNPKRRLNRPSSFFDKDRKAKKYHSLGDDDIVLEPRITHVQRSETAFGGGCTPIDAKDDDALISDLDLFIQSMSKCIGTEKFGLSFEFTDLKFQPKKAAKPILSEVTGKIDRSSLWGVMGASGAGKSTFVNVLMGKIAHTGGTTKINGVQGDIKKYKKIIGYVPQDDIVLPELTVRENILHSARIRLPSNWNDSQIQRHVDILISCLQLAHVKDSLVGSAANPVISGGQRKRVSIGIELAAAPMALFLDEPTSGLDATSASSIMSTLKELSRLNITVITIIHQPRAEIFESLDSLILFGKGRVIYQGPEQDVRAYFENLGFHFPPSGNPADTIMDIIAGQGHLYKTSGDSRVWPLIHNWKQLQASQTPRFRSNLPTPALPSHSRSTSRENINTNASPYLSLIDSRHTSASYSKTEEALSLRRSIRSRGAPFYKQTYHCLLRSLLQQFRMRSSFFFEIGVSALGGFLIGLAHLKSEGISFRGNYLEPYTILSSSLDYSAVPQMSLLVGIAIGLIASSPGVKIFGEEKLVYWRESSSGHSRLGYYLGKVVSTVPRMLVACLHFTAMFHVLSTPRIDWGSAFLANLLYFWCIYGLASILSMCSRREDGPLLAVMASLIVGVLNGMSPNLTVVGDWHLSWLWRSLPGTWLAEAYFGKNVGWLGYLYSVGDASRATGYRLGGFGWDCCVLGIIGVVYRVIAFGLMRVVNQRGKG